MAGVTRGLRQYARLHGQLQAHSARAHLHQPASRSACCSGRRSTQHALPASECIDLRSGTAPRGQCLSSRSTHYVCVWRGAGAPLERPTQRPMRRMTGFTNHSTQCPHRRTTREGETCRGRTGSTGRRHHTTHPLAITHTNLPYMARPASLARRDSQCGAHGWSLHPRGLTCAAAPPAALSGEVHLRHSCGVWRSRATPQPRARLTAPNRPT